MASYMIRPEQVCRSRWSEGDIICLKGTTYGDADRPAGSTVGGPYIA